jgi:hypothetical protein
MYMYVEYKWKVNSKLGNEHILANFLRGTTSEQRNSVRGFYNGGPALNQARSYHVTPC